MNKVPENPLKNRKEDFGPLCAISGLLVMLYITSNVLAVKIINVGGLSLFDSGTVTFPFAYMLGDILAEVYGYRTAKKVIILTFVCNIAFIAFTSIAIILPYPEYMEETQRSFEAIFSYVPRIVFSSLLAFLSGELVNAKVLVKIKERQKNGKMLFIRTIGSSLIAYIFDTVLFVLLAFLGTVPFRDILSMIWVQYLAKALIEACLGTPLAYLGVSYLRKTYGTLQHNR